MVAGSCRNLSLMHSEPGFISIQTPIGFRASAAHVVLPLRLAFYNNITRPSHGMHVPPSGPSPNTSVGMPFHSRLISEKLVTPRCPCEEILPL